MGAGTCAATESRHPQHLLQTAAEHRTKGQFDQAEALYWRLLELHPNHLRAMLGLGACARQRGDRATALERYEAAAAAHPDHPQPLLEMAAEHAAQERLDEADATYRRVLELQPNQLQALLGLGRCARQGGDRATALERFQAAAARHPDHLQPLLEMAAEHAAQERLDEADATYRRVLELQPNQLQALLGLGRCARQRGDRATALERFQAVAVAHPSHPGALLELATEHRALGQFDADEALCRRVLEKHPDHLWGMLSLGRCARQRGDRAAALDQFKAAAAAHPSHPEALQEMATEHRALGQTEAAEAVCHRVLELRPNELWAMLGLGACARQRGDRATALERFEAAATVHPWEAQPLLEMATEQRALGRIEEGEALYRRVLERHPTQLQAMLGLGGCARQRGDRATALERFEAAATVHPWEAQPLLEMATEQRALGRIEEGEALYRRVLECHPTQLQAMLGLGGCARQRGDRATALERFEAAATVHPWEAQPLLEMATEQRALGQTEAAEAVCHRVLELRPNELWAMLGLGACARQRGDRATALERFEAAATVHPWEAQPLLEMATEQRALGRIEEGEALYRRVLERHPTQLQAMLGLGGCARQRGDRATALERFEAAATVHPWEAQPLLEIATEHRAQERLDEAEATYRRLLKLRSNDMGAMLGLGGCARQRGDRATTLEQFQVAAAAHPLQPQPLLEMAAAELELGEPEASRRTLERARVLDANHIPTVLALARHERSVYSFDRSADLLQESLCKNPANVQVLLALSTHWIEAGYPEKALDVINTSCYQIGYCISIDMMRVRILRNIGQLSQAQALAQTLIKKVPWNFSAKIAYCELEWSLRGKDVARDFLSEIQPTTAAETVTLYCLRARMDEEDGEINSALDYYKRALSLQPNAAHLHTQLARLHLISLNANQSRAHLKLFMKHQKSMRLMRGQSLNSSQSQIGQLLDELVLESDALSELNAISEEPVAERLRSLCQFIQRHPDYTAGAVQFLLALAKDGWINRWPLSGSSIPKTIVQYWDSDDIPEYLRSISETWKTYNPNYQHIIFNDISAKEFLRSRYSSEVTAAYSRAAEPAQKSDIFRLAYLFAEGGYYADMDDRCLCPLDGFLPPLADFIGWQENMGALCNNFIAAPGRSPIIYRALRDAVVAMNRGDRDILWLSTGPGVLSRAFAGVIAESKLVASAWLNRIFLLSHSSILKGILIHSNVPYKKTQKHWFHTAFGKDKLTQAPRKRVLRSRQAPSPQAA